MTTTKYISQLEIMISKERINNNTIAVRELINLLQEIKENSIDRHL